MAKFFPHKVTKEAITAIEYEDPFEHMKMFALVGVESKALTLEDVPQEYRPYKGCLFDVLGEPDNDARLSKLKEFFRTLAQEGDPGRYSGLLYTVMHIWKVVYMLALRDPPTPEYMNTFEYFISAGMIDALVRILQYCIDKEFRVIEYNRYIPYRILEVFFAGTQADIKMNDFIIEKILEDDRRAFNTFYPIIRGAISWLEQLSCCQVLGNLSCYPTGVLWLLDNPDVVGAVGIFLWSSFDVLYLNYRQYEERCLLYHKALLNTELEVRRGSQRYQPNPVRIGDLTTFVCLCAVCNICAAHPEEPMEKIQRCMLAIVKEGYYWNLSTVCFGILLNNSKYTEMTIEKFLSFTAWTCFNKESQRIALAQLLSLPSSRLEDLLAFSRHSFTKSCSVIACLLTHALWLDYDKGSHFAILGLVSLLTEDDEIAMEVVKVAGSQLYDLAHSFHHVKMPGDGDPLSVKRGIMEPLLRLGGYSFYNEKGQKPPPASKTFENPPECVQEVRAFCERYVKELKMGRLAKQRAVKYSDLLKMEGNQWFAKGEYRGAIECYTLALEACPLTVTERRVTYYSNRAECYLKIHQPRKAVRDCNKALAMNPLNLKARWRRSNAWQNIGMKYPAALDLLTIRRKENEAKEILGEKVYYNLDETIVELMDQGTFLELPAMKHGNVIYTGTLNRKLGINRDKADDKTSIPPYKGQTYQDIFGLPKRELFSL